ncbi:MAG: hypothetical protein V2I56_20020 [Desulfobacteraceae bacterium]|jgi:hypothetical protein|nr:hypothetical protein [Desulfobacteraceae bacterium]
MAASSKLWGTLRERRYRPTASIRFQKLAMAASILLKSDLKRNQQAAGDD